MGLHKNYIVKFGIIYIAQVGTLWGLLEGYSYFEGDGLKNFLGPFWLLIYVLPIFTTLYVVLRVGREETAVQENIETKGDYSPGKVGDNYSVGDNRDQGNNEVTDVPEEGTPAAQQPVIKESILTQGDFSPGKVSKNYRVNISETAHRTPSPELNREELEGEQKETKAGKNIRTTGNYSPGEVGGDYTADV